MADRAISRTLQALISQCSPARIPHSGGWVCGDTVIKGNVKYLMFSPPSRSKTCVGFHVLRAARSCTWCIPPSKEKNRGVSLEKRNTGAVLRKTWDEKEKNKQSSAPGTGRGRPWAWDTPAARGTSGWSGGAVFPASDKEESWDITETFLVEEPWFTLKKISKNPICCRMHCLALLQLVPDF